MATFQGIGDRDRVDVILTNPPFGGEEQRGILSNFPADKQTAETALLFLQLIMRKLRRQPKPGRAAQTIALGQARGVGGQRILRKLTPVRLGGDPLQKRILIHARLPYQKLE